MGAMSVHEHEKSKSDRMRKKLGQQHRSKSECRDPEEDKPEAGQSSQKPKKNEKVKKRQATVPNSSTMSSIEKDHASRSSSSFSCCQCHHPNTPTTDVICRK